jgi:hypothetical protein
MRAAAAAAATDTIIIGEAINILSENEMSR